jgi:hypothetical protein
MHSEYLDRRSATMGDGSEGYSNAIRPTSLNRRRALRVLGSLAAAAGAAAFVAERPEPASATTTFSSTDSTIALEADNSGGGDAFHALVGGTTGSAIVAESSRSTDPVVEVSNDGGGFGIRSIGTTGVLGDTSGTHPTAIVAGVWGRCDITGSGVGVEGDNSGTGPGVLGDITGSVPSSLIHVGVWGRSGGSGAGVEGDNSSSGPGVFGKNSSTGPGMWGDIAGTAPVTIERVGVWGRSSGTNEGVRGDSSGSAVAVLGNATGTGGGVEGIARSSAAAVTGFQISSGPGVVGNAVLGGGIGVQGATTSAANGHPAVLGQNGGAGPGVQGFSSGNGSIGISGGTDVGVGFWGTANGSGVGVLGSSITGTGIWGQSQSYFAGVFSGPVLVQGNFSVTGAKSAVVRGADGGLKRMYSLESPESWFEDFGSDKLSGGSATVQLEPGFAGVVHGDKYHVFLTPDGDSKGLYVTSKTPGSFKVAESGGGTSNVGFSYRVVAKRKDIPGARLEHVDEPPTLPDNFKTPPTPPKLPDLPAESRSTVGG